MRWRPLTDLVDFRNQRHVLLPNFYCSFAVRLLCCRAHPVCSSAGLFPEIIITHTDRLCRTTINSTHGLHVTLSLCLSKGGEQTRGHPVHTESHQDADQGHITPDPSVVSSAGWSIAVSCSLTEVSSHAQAYEWKANGLERHHSRSPGGNSFVAIS